LDSVRDVPDSVQDGLVPDGQGDPSEVHPFVDSVLDVPVIPAAPAFPFRDLPCQASSRPGPFPAFPTAPASSLRDASPFCAPSWNDSSSRENPFGDLQGPSYDSRDPSSLGSSRGNEDPFPDFSYPSEVPWRGQQVQQQALELLIRNFIDLKLRVKEIFNLFLAQVRFLKTLKFNGEILRDWYIRSEIWSHNITLQDELPLELVFSISVVIPVKPSKITGKNGSKAERSL
jgi:hypothetical protein